MKIHFIIIVLLLIAGSAYAQKKTILHGAVSDTANSPVIGASVTSAFGKTIAVNTEEGFDLPVTRFPDTLTVSAVGYTTRQMIISNALLPLDVVLSLAPGHLKEVVVNTGYQKIPRERATGSFYFIDNKLLNERVSPDIMSRLDGITSGLLVNKMPNLINFTSPLRGLSTLNQEAMMPLIVR